MQSLRCLFSLLLASAGLAWSSHSAADDLSSDPYTVYVAQESAYARCGPSGEHYRTDRLRHGQALEVYAETEDGWLGIRPPEDSFCWVIAESVDISAGQDRGRVTEDRTVSWIGTHLGRARQYRWQVQLAKGEEVSVIGRSQREGPDGPQTWYRIVPPSGEFRWVHRDQVVETSEELVASISRASRSSQTEFLPEAPTRQASQSRRSPRREVSVLQAAPEPEPERERVSQVTRSPRPTPREIEPAAAVEPIGSGLSEDWQASQNRNVVSPENVPRQPDAFSNAARRDPLAAVEFTSRPRISEIGAVAPQSSLTAGDSNWVGASRNVAPAVARGPANGGVIAQVGATAPIAVGNQVTGNTGTLTPTEAPALTRLNVVTPEQIARVEAETRGADLDRLSLIFSRLMAARASGAECEPLARAAVDLANASTDQVLAGRARLLAERVQQYQRVAQRRDGEVLIQSSLQTQVPPQPTPLGATGGKGPVSQTGYLVQVYSARSSSPPFALTDNTGRTIAYVTPSPGVNVRTYLNTHIKVTGQQGFVRGLNTPHIFVTQAFPVPQ